MLLQMSRCDVTTINQSEPSSAWSSDMTSPSKKMFKMHPSASKVTCAAFWDEKGVILLDSLGPGQTASFMMLAEWKAGIFRVRTEKKTTFLLQHDNTWPHTSLNTMENITDLGCAVLTHPPHIWIQCLLTSTCSSWWKMDCMGNVFLAKMPSLAAVKQWVTSTGADRFERSLKALVHCCQILHSCIVNGSDCWKVMFCSWEFVLSSSVIVFVGVDLVEKNRRYYFHCILEAFYWSFCLTRYFLRREKNQSDWCLQNK